MSSRKSSQTSKAEPVLSACSDVHKTLFDHRPFASGEINYLIKSNDPLITQIESSISTSVTLIKEEQSDKQSQVQEFVQSCHLQKLSSKIDQLNLMAKRVLDNELESDLQRKKAEEKQNEHRQQHQKSLDVKFNQRSDDLEQFYVRKRNELVGHYESLQAKWKQEEESS